MFALRPGRRSDLPPIAMGSHLDTQPTGGKFDGVLGRAGRAGGAAHCCMRSDYETNAPLMLVNWTNGGGRAVRPLHAGRGGSCRYLSAGEGRNHNRPSREQACARRWKRSAIAARRPWAASRFPAMFELHIEQGPILEAGGAHDRPSSPASRGCAGNDVTFTGRESHTGTTPMPLRRKRAFLGAARVIERVDAIARAHAPHAVGTVGMVRGATEFPQCDPGRGLLHRRFPPSRNGGVGGGWMRWRLRCTRLWARWPTRSVLRLHASSGHA